MRVQLQASLGPDPLLPLQEPCPPSLLLKHTPNSTSGLRFLRGPTASEIESALQAASHSCSCLSLPAVLRGVWTLWSQVRGWGIREARATLLHGGTGVGCPTPAAQTWRRFLQGAHLLSPGQVCAGSQG